MTQADVERIAGICNAHTLVLSLVARQLADNGLLEKSRLIKDLQEARDHSAHFLPHLDGREEVDSSMTYGFVHALKAVQLALSQKGNVEAVPVSTEIRRTMQAVHHA